MPQPRTTTMLAIDRIACDGHGMCAELLPERIDLDEWGYPIISAEPISPQLVGAARRAAARCPVLALRLREAPVAATSVVPDRRTPLQGRATVGALR